MRDEIGIAITHADHNQKELSHMEHGNNEHDEKDHIAIDIDEACPGPGSTKPRERMSDAGMLRKVGPWLNYASHSYDVILMGLHLVWHGDYCLKAQFIRHTLWYRMVKGLLVSFRSVSIHTYLITIISPDDHISGRVWMNKVTVVYLMRGAFTMVYMLSSLFVSRWAGNACFSTLLSCMTASTEDNRITTVLLHTYECTNHTMVSDKSFETKCWETKSLETKH